MKAARPTNQTAQRWYFSAGLLAIILAVLFWRSFAPGYVHFSNDGPLGAQQSEWLQFSGHSLDMWDDLNFLGINGGSWPPNIDTFFHWVLGPLFFSKFFQPISLFLLGFSAWIFFKQLKLTPLAALLGALAAALNSTFFATAGWGLGGQLDAFSMDFLALALVVSNNETTPTLTRWIRLALAGLAVGINVMEAADIGAIFSVFVAAFIFYKVLIEHIVALSRIERVVVLCCVNGAFLSLFVMGIVFGLGIFKLFLLLVLLLVAAVALNWSLTRKLIPLTKIEKIATLSSVNLAFLLLFVCGIMHGFGLFAIVALLIVAVILNWALLYYHLFVNRCGLGIIRLAVIVLFAGFMATQIVVTLVSTQIQGVAGTGQDTETKAAHWDFATQWSMPKKETLGLFVPGLFGYKMDTPNNMMPAVRESYKGGAYWGGVGRDPAIDRFFDSGQTGTPPQGIMRFSGGGNYCGILVALVAFWAIAQSFRRQDSIFPEVQKKFIWFWAVILFVSLLFAFGRFAQFYGLLYKLPYFSTIRNPIKFLHVFSWAIVILFAYGIHGLSRLYLEPAVGKTASPPSQLGNWWAKVRGFDRKWTLACAITFGISLLGWFLYASETPSLVRYLQKVGFGDEDMAREIAAFSVSQAGWFVSLFAVAAGLFILVIAGFFSGKRAKLGGFLLGLLLVLDLSRANLPYIIHWNYIQKYEIGSLNPIVDFLRDKPYEHRVAVLPFEAQQQLRSYDNYFGGNGGVYRIEWAQHHFLYYNIQSLDIIQMPRMPEDLAAWSEALLPNTPDRVYLIVRRWELSNTRYLLGPVGFLNALNEQLDPAQHRFRIVRRFDMVPKPGILQLTDLEGLTAVPAADGDLALFEFTGALPRAKLFANWQVSTNDDATLKTLADKNFDPQQTVLVSTPLPASSASATNENSGTVEFKSYASKDIVFDAKADAPTVLLLNDKYDPNWRVTVDGKPAEMLRCNFIMRGVYLTPGAHTVEFQFRMPNKPLYVTLAAIGVGILLCGFLFFSSRRNPQP